MQCLTRNYILYIIHNDAENSDKAGISGASNSPHARITTFFYNSYTNLFSTVKTFSYTVQSETQNETLSRFIHRKMLGNR